MTLPLKLNSEAAAQTIREMGWDRSVVPAPAMLLNPIAAIFGDASSPWGDERLMRPCNHVGPCGCPTLADL